MGTRADLAQRADGMADADAGAAKQVVKAGQVLFKLGRYDEAIAAWTRALAGDGDSIDKADVDRKIKAAKQKLPKK